MAVMGRGKRANAQGWNAINKQREKENNKPEPKKEEKKASKEEMERIIRLVKEATAKKS